MTTDLLDIKTKQKNPTKNKTNNNNKKPHQNTKSQPVPEH